MSDVVGLTNSELWEIERNEANIAGVLQSLENARQFKLNDYLVASELNANSEWQPVVNSYAVRVKYKVVHVDKNGAPYIKMIGSNGRPRGALLSITKGGGYIHAIDTQYFKFEHDPHFVESIILSAESTYDPTEVQKDKKTLRDIITRHNKESKINCNDVPYTVAFMNGVKVGDVLWFSKKNYVTVTQVNTVQLSPKNINDIKNKGAWARYYKNISSINYIEVQLSNGTKKSYSPLDLLNKNVYVKQPRSYKELSDTI